MNNAKIGNEFTLQGCSGRPNNTASLELKSIDPKAIGYKHLSEMYESAKNLVGLLGVDITFIHEGLSLHVSNKTTLDSLKNMFHARQLNKEHEINYKLRQRIKDLESEVTSLENERLKRIARVTFKNQLVGGAL